MAKRETTDQSDESIIDIIKRNPTVLKDTGVQRAVREWARAFNKFDRVFKSYERTRLFAEADAFVTLIKIRKVQKSEFTKLDLDRFQRAFNQFRDNFPEYLHMVADMLEG